MGRREQDKLVMVWGAAKSGKTTLIRRWMESASQEPGWRIEPTTEAARCLAASSPDDVPAAEGQESPPETYDFTCTWTDPAGTTSFVLSFQEVPEPAGLEGIRDVEQHRGEPKGGALAEVLKGADRIWCVVPQGGASTSGSERLLNGLLRWLGHVARLGAVPVVPLLRLVHMSLEGEPKPEGEAAARKAASSVTEDLLKGGALDGAKKMELGSDAWEADVRDMMDEFATATRQNSDPGWWVAIKKRWSATPPARLWGASLALALVLGLVVFAFWWSQGSSTVDAAAEGGPSLPAQATQGSPETTERCEVANSVRHWLRRTEDTAPYERAQELLNEGRDLESRLMRDCEPGDERASLKDAIHARSLELMKAPPPLGMDTLRRVVGDLWSESQRAWATGRTRGGSAHTIFYSRLAEMAREFNGDQRYAPEIQQEWELLVHYANEQRGGVTFVPAEDEPQIAALSVSDRLRWGSHELRLEIWTSTVAGVRPFADDTVVSDNRDRSPSRPCVTPFVPGTLQPDGRAVYSFRQLHAPAGAASPCEPSVRAGDTVYVRVVQQPSWWDPGRFARMPIRWFAQHLRQVYVFTFEPRLTVEQTLPEGYHYADGDAGAGARLFWRMSVHRSARRPQYFEAPAR